jgi:hypothetical protein
MEQCEKAIMETDQTSRKGQVKGTYPNILDDLLKRALKRPAEICRCPLANMRPGRQIKHLGKGK